jgi:hypothetical protein
MKQYINPINIILLLTLMLIVVNAKKKESSYQKAIKQCWFYKDKYYDHLYEQSVKAGYDSLELFTLNCVMDDVDIVSLDGNTKKLSSIVKCSTLIYRFSDVSCSYCVENDIDILRQINDSLGIPGKIISLAQLPDVKYLNIYNRTLGIDFPIYNRLMLIDIPIEFDSIVNNPYFVIVNENMKIEFVKASDPSSKIDDHFFQRVLTFL